MTNYDVIAIMVMLIFILISIWVATIVLQNEVVKASDSIVQNCSIAHGTE